MRTFDTLVIRSHYNLFDKRGEERKRMNGKVERRVTRHRNPEPNAQ